MSKEVGGETPSEKIQIRNFRSIFLVLITEYRNFTYVVSCYKSSLIILCCLLSSYLISSAEGRSVLHQENVVHTRLGIIRGVEQTFENSKLTAFLGVPYAKPPVGERRFSRPQMVDKWHGEFDARTLAPTCITMIDRMFPEFPGSEMWNPPGLVSEDCLKMNIWVPEEHDGNVMIWIFGGGFYSGSPSLELYDGTVLAAKKRTIIVNINYRLGPFGFLHFGEDSPIDSNVGLLDQQMALRWVHENIGAFGGDKNRVTIFGESAGSASTTAHLFAPGSHKYFRRIIIKSGTILNSWAIRPPEAMLDSSMQLAKRLNCTGQPVEKIYECLRGVPAALLQKEADEVASLIELPMTFAFVPVSEENTFFEGNVFDKLKRRDFKKDLDVVIGTVKDEGTYWLPYYMYQPKYGFNFNHTISAEDPHNKALITSIQYKESVNAFMPYFGNSPLVKHAIMNAYQEVSDKQNLEERLRDGIGRFLGDYFFTCSVIEFADLMADHIYGNTYMYYYTHRSSANSWPRWMGVMHGYEIDAVFGQVFFRPSLYDPTQIEAERQFATYIMKLWVDFASTGQPTPYWPKYNKIERKALELGDESIRDVHRVVVDVHGTYCRLIEEGKAVAGQVSDCRSRRTDPNTPPLNSRVLSISASLSLSNSLISHIPLLALIAYYVIF